METISQYDAMHAGLKFFYTGRPCFKGHESKRYCSTGGCWACSRERTREGRIRANSAAVGERVLTVYLPAGQLEEARALARAMGWRLFDGREQLV